MISVPVGEKLHFRNTLKAAACARTRSARGYTQAHAGNAGLQYMPVPHTAHASTKTMYSWILGFQASDDLPFMDAGEAAGRE